jgi:hypothetical protein
MSRRQLHCALTWNIMLREKFIQLTALAFLQLCDNILLLCGNSQEGKCSRPESAPSALRRYWTNELVMLAGLPEALGHIP